MNYPSIEQQIHRNNLKSILLLLMFPLITLLAVWIFILLLQRYDLIYTYDTTGVFLRCVPIVLLIFAIWFLIAWLSNVWIINKVTRAKPLQREECPRVYDIVERMCHDCHMPMPRLEIIQDNGLNAFACGMSQRNYTIAITSGLLERLTDEELAGVLGHELTHIRNHDTQLSIIGTVFVDLITTSLSVACVVIMAALFSNALSGKKSAVGLAISLCMIVLGVLVAICAAIALLFTQLTHFSLSRKREYVADAGGAQLSGKPLALASALRKITYNTGLTQVKHEAICHLFIENHRRGFFSSISKRLENAFNTHPSMERRIELLEQYAATYRP